MITAEELVNIVVDDGGSKITKMATVVELFVSGKPKLQFDGEDTPSEKEYEPLGSYSPAINDRVLLLGASGTWVILGKIGFSDGGTPGTGFKNMVVDGYFQHTGGPNAETGVAFFGKAPARQRTTSMLPTGASLSTVITHVNNMKTTLQSFGFYE